MERDLNHSEVGQNSEKKYDEILNLLYTDPSKPSSFSSAGNLYYYAKKIVPEITFKDVGNFLTRSKTWTSFKKRPKRHFPRRMVFTSYVDETWQIDTAFMISLKQFNSGVQYLLVCLDAFSRYLYIRCLKSKKNEEVLEAFRSIISENNGKSPEWALTDKGSELNWLDPAFAEFEIKRYSVSTHLKAQMVERVILTIKRTLWKTMVHRGTLRYVDILQDVVRGYNHRVHRSLFGFSPTEAKDPKNFETIKTAFLKKYREYGNQFRKKPPKFKENDIVRILKDRSTFHRGYKENFSPETYTINKVFNTKPYTFGIPHFKKKFYEWELVRASPSRSDYFIDQISEDESRLRSGRSKNIHKRYLIKDRNDVTFSRWVDEKDLKDFENEHNVELKHESSQ